MTLVQSKNHDLEVLEDQGKSVLIVEDEKDVRNVLESYLEQNGYDAFVATNGKEALEILDRIPKPSLILLDLLMPEMNGWEFCKRLKDDPFYSSIPIIVLTAFPRVEKLFDEMKGIEVIKKPIDLDVLLPRVKEHLLNSWFGDL